MQHPATITTALRWATSQLTPTSPTARLDAELLLAHVLGWNRSTLLAERTTPLSQPAIEQFGDLISRRANREPVAYLIGQREFYGLSFMVDRRVLIPRPETELLVDLALERLRSLDGSPRILDLCTGSGCIAIAIAHQLPNVHVHASDLSADALSIAQLNVVRYELTGRITFHHGDLFAPLDGQFDLIVSNPPYTILSEIELGVYQYEPHLALDGGAAGLDLYQRILAQAPTYLASGGSLLLEIGASQAASIVALAEASWVAPAIEVHRDLAGHDRVVAIQI
jgi:release factor glutamine methyltransferase